MCLLIFYYKHQACPYNAVHFSGINSHYSGPSLIQTVPYHRNIKSVQISEFVQIRKSHGRSFDGCSSACASILNESLCIAKRNWPSDHSVWFVAATSIKRCGRRFLGLCWFNIDRSNRWPGPHLLVFNYLFIVTLFTYKIIIILNYWLWI